MSSALSGWMVQARRLKKSASSLLPFLSFSFPKKHAVLWEEKGYMQIRRKGVSLARQWWLMDDDWMDALHHPSKKLL